MRQRADLDLATAATSALVKIGAVVPDSLVASLEQPALVTAPDRSLLKDGADIALVRKVIRDRREISVKYEDAAGTGSERLLWPIALAYFESSRLLAAWCVTRQGFRHFRVDRLANITMTGRRYPASRAQLLRSWREQDPMRGLRC